MNEFFSAALSALPSVATSPLAFLAYLATIIAFVVIALKVKRNANLLRHLEKLPEADRLRALRDEVGVSVPENVTAADWLRARSQQYKFMCFVIGAVLIAFLIALAIFHRPGPTRTALDELNGAKWIKRCFLQVPESWAHLAELIGPPRVTLRPSVGSLLRESNFSLSVTIDERAVTEDQQHKANEQGFSHAPGKGQLSDFRGTCYDLESPKRPPPSDAPVVRTVYFFEDGESQGECRLNVSVEGGAQTAALEWDPSVNPYPDGSEYPFVAFRCSASRTLSRNEFIDACRMLIERNTQTQDSRDFAECVADYKQGFVRPEQ